MTSMTFKSLTLALAVAGASLFGSHDAQAATLGSCVVSSTIDVTNKVTPTSLCFALNGLSDGDAAKLADLNALSINGTTGGWTSLGKFEPTGSNTYYSLDDSIESLKQGEWDIFAAATSLYGEFMMVFKGGNDNNTDPASFVGYILAGTSGTWSSPLIATTGGSAGTMRDLSNVELFARGAPSVIPLPAAGWLLLGGLGGLFAMRRRKAA